MRTTAAAPERPTLDQVKRWPATANVEDGALALGVSRSGLYQAIAEGTCPVQVIKVGSRLKILTHSLVAVLEGSAKADHGQGAA
jgi:hypothetical protein